MKKLLLPLCLAAFGFWVSISAHAAGTFINLPPASVPLGNVPDAVPLDQGANCSQATPQNCVTSQAPSLRIGQPIQTTCASIVSPWLYQQCDDTSVSPVVRKMWLGVSVGWSPMFVLSPSGGFSFASPTFTAAAINSPIATFLGYPNLTLNQIIVNSNGAGTPIRFMFQEGGTSAPAIGTDGALGFEVLRQGVTTPAIHLSYTGGLLLGENSQMGISNGQPVSIVGPSISNNSGLIVEGPAGGVGLMVTLNSGSSGTPSYIQYDVNGVQDFQAGINSGGQWYLARTGASPAGGIQYTNLGTIAFGENQQLTIQQSGGVQIISPGTSTPALSVQGEAAGSGLYTVFDSNAASQPVQLQLKTNGSLKFYAGLDTSSDFVIYNQGDAANAMSITPAGAVALGENSSKALALAGAISVTVSSDSTHTTATVCEDTTTHVLYFGSGASGVCAGTSSRRYKRDIKPTTDGLAQVMAIRPDTFLYRAGYEDSGAKTHYGFIAENVVRTLPLLVDRDKKGRPNSVDVLGMLPVLWHAVQEQQAEITALRQARH